MRARVLAAIRERPLNTLQLAQALHVDYTTVRHHLRVMMKNGLVVTSGEGYGKMYFLSPMMESHWGQLMAILEKAGRAAGVQSHAAN